MSAGSGITERQRKFAERFVIHGNATRAAEEAGYEHPNVTSAKLVKNPKVASLVDALRGKLAGRLEKQAERRVNATIADAEEIQGFLSRVMRGEETEVELTLSGDQEKVPPKLETRRKAAMDLAKLHGLIVNRNEHTGKDGGPLDVRAYQEMSAAELEAKAEELMRSRRK